MFSYSDALILYCFIKRRRKTSQKNGFSLTGKKLLQPTKRRPRRSMASTNGEARPSASCPDTMAIEEEEFEMADCDSSQDQQSRRGPDSQ